jgi:ParB family chromosome partitioning protein
MVRAMPPRKAAVAKEPKAPKAPAKPRTKKPGAEPGTVGLTADEVGAGDADEIASTVDQIAGAGGRRLACYREPLGGHWVVLAALPLDKVQPTPFQRELSDSHAKRLVEVIPKVGRFLDPIVAVANQDETGWMTPNGMHRLEAMRRLGAKSIVALVVPDREIAYRILALNTEKAHNLKDKALEVVRMADQIAATPTLGAQPESTWAFEFEEAAYLTIGRAYLERPRFAGGAYLPVVKRCDAFDDRPMTEMVAVRAARSAKLLQLDDEVARCVAELKESGLQSPYLKPFVVARLNPLRFQKGDAKADFDATLDKMLSKAATFEAGKVKPTDLAGAYGGGGDE